MKITKAVNSWIIKLKNDYALRTFISSSLSFIITFAFVLYNIFLDIVYRAVWNIGIAVYYSLLLFIRAYVIFSEYNFFKKKTDECTKEQARKRLFLIQSILLLVIDLALIAPISMMILEQKAINYSKVPAISIATYTCYKIIISSRNYVKTRKGKQLSVRTLRNVNFIDALVSVLSLQYTLIMTFGEGINGDMRLLCIISSFSVWALIIVISVLALIRAFKIRVSKNKTKDITYLNKQAD